MHKFVTILALSAGLACAGLIAATPAAAQSAAPAAQPDALAQMELTEPLIKQYLEAQPDINAFMGQATEPAGDTPDPKVLAKLDEIAKKHKFANFSQLDVVAGNIMLVLQGMDPKTKKYIGSAAALKQQIAELKADTKIAADDKKQELDELNQEMKAIIPVKFNTNIDLVTKYYDQLAAEPAAAK